VIVCVCRALSDSAIRSLIETGADTPGRLVAACGAGGDCGRCCTMLRDLIAEARGEKCAAASSSPYVTAGGAS
jgi:bacterioferritin-associated ferredoxin